MKNSCGPFIRLIVLFLALLLGCEKNYAKGGPPAPRGHISGVDKKVLISSNQFGFRLFNAVNGREGKKNIFISPLSVSVALGMLLNGAQGATYDSVQQTLALEGLTTAQINDSYKNLIALLTQLDRAVTFSISNSLWHRKEFPVRSDYLSTNRKYFNALVQSLDFTDPEAASMINAWVRKSTNGKIQGIVDPPLPIDMMMVLINAIYFKGIWTYKFDPAGTADDAFTLPGGSIKTVRMMNQSKKYLYFQNDHLQMVDLPYGKEGFRMTVVLPDVNMDIDGLISGISREVWDGWIGSLDSMKGSLSLPKFKLSYDIALNDLLKSLGMGIAFDPGQADFKGINSDGRLYVSKVKHKSYVEVGENGTEAAAATSIGISLTSTRLGSEKTFIMIVNRPFLFVIRDAVSGTILFIGKIVDPG